MSGLGSPSLDALVRAMNEPTQHVQVGTYEFEVTDEPIKGVNGRDDDVGWTLTHYNAVSNHYLGVHYLLLYRPRLREENQLDRRTMDHVVQRTERYSVNCRLLADKHDRMLELNRAASS
jgi:hypothetical protein